jgi:hypothetical protein
MWFSPVEDFGVVVETSTMDQQTKGSNPWRNRWRPFLLTFCGELFLAPFCWPTPNPSQAQTETETETETQNQNQIQTETQTQTQNQNQVQTQTQTQTLGALHLIRRANRIY